MAENPETWNDDVKAIAKIMDHAAHSDVFGASVMLEIEQTMVAPLRRRILELEVRLRAYRDSPMVHRRCATYDPTLGKKIDTRCDTCKAVDFLVEHATGVSPAREIDAYDWQPIMPDSLPDFDDLLLQDLNPPWGAWHVTNKHYTRSVSYEKWIELGYGWFAKMRVPKDYVPPEQQ